MFFPNDPVSVQQIVRARVLEAELERSGRTPIPASDLVVRRWLADTRRWLHRRRNPHLHHALSSYGSLDLFAGLDRRTLRRLSHSFFVFDVGSGESLGRQGDVVPEFVVVLQGRVGVSVDGLPLAVLDPGAHFGALPLLDSGPTPYRRASFDVLERTRIAVANRSQFHDIMTIFPLVGRRIEKIADVRRAYLAGRTDAVSDAVANVDRIGHQEFPLHVADIEWRSRLIEPDSVANP